MQDITKLLSKANKQLDELNKTVSSLDSEKGQFATVKKQVLDYRNKVSSVKHSLRCKKSELMTILFDFILMFYGGKSYTIGARGSQKNVTLAVGAWKFFKIIGGQHDHVLLVDIGKKEHNELFALMWDAMLDDVKKHLTNGPSDISKRIHELDKLKKQLEALPLICPQVVMPS